MVEIDTAKMTHLIDRIKSQICCLSDILSDLHLWIKSEQGLYNSDEETVVLIKRKFFEIEQSVKNFKKIVRSMDKAIISCDFTQSKALGIIENVESFSLKAKSENLKINDLTKISEILSDYKFDVR